MCRIEQADTPLRRINSVFSDKHSYFSKATRLRYAIKAINNTTWEKCFVPSMIFFAVMSSLGNSGANKHKQEQRFEAMKQAWEEAATIAAENSISRELKSIVPTSAKYTIKTGQVVMVYSEKRKKWVKDLNVVKVGTKMIWVNDGDWVFKLNRTHVVPQPNDEDRSSIEKIATKALAPRLPPSSQFFEEHKYSTQTICNGSSGKFDQSIAEEIVGFVNKKAFKVVVRQEIGEVSNVLGDTLNSRLRIRGYTRRSSKRDTWWKGTWTKKRTG